MKEKQVNIMLVDDDVVSTCMATILIRKTFSDVNLHVFNQPAAALHSLQKHIVAADLILLDYNMPEINGEKFLEETDKITDLNAYIIFLSSEDLKKLGYLEHPRVVGLWTKPLQVDALRLFFKNYLLRH